VKTIAAVSFTACIVLAASMVGIYLNFTVMMQQQSNIINEQRGKLQSNEQAINEMAGKLEDLSREVQQVNSTVYSWDPTIANLTRDMGYFQLPN
jgi:peptidoglycan hydrolase CwlO-like protein